MNLPLLTLFEIERYENLWLSLRAAGPRRAHLLMTELAALDSERYDRAADARETRRAYAERARTAMRSLPRVPAHLIDAAADWYGDYGPRMQRDASYIMLWLSDRDRLSEVVRIEGREHLDAAIAAGSGVLALPLHLGASYVIPPLLGHIHPTRFVVNRMDVETLKRFAFPDLDVSAFAVDDASTFRRGLRALKAGQIFAMFPEYDPRGQGHRHQEVEFLGASIKAPQGPALLSAAAGSPMIPMHLDGEEDGTFVLRIHEPIPAPSRAADDGSSIASLWRLIEDLLLDGRLGDWEMWTDFDHMRAGACR
jgi:lauroyl/myristoyl acyltransferase